MPWGFAAAAAVGAVGSVIASGNAEDAANNATAAQSASAADAAALGREQLAFNKEQYYADKPLRDKAAGASIGLMEQSVSTAKSEQQLADEYAAYQRGTFRPLEQKIVADATGYDTPERRAEEMARARAGVESAYSGSIDALNRNLGRGGITPGSGKSQALMQDAALTKAGAISGATSGASRNVETMGVARMADAANLGRNLPSAQATAAGLGINAGNAGVNAGTAAIQQSAAGIPAVNTGYNGAIQGLSVAGGLYGQAGRTYDAIAGANAGALAGFGNAAGRIAATPQFGTYMSGLFRPTANTGTATLNDLDLMYAYASSKKIKKGTGKKLSGKKALKQIEDTPVKDGWSYDPSKGGPDDGGRKHAGAMAQDIQKHMGNEVAPDGEVVDIPTMHGHLMAGMSELSKRVKRIERKVA